MDDVAVALEHVDLLNGLDGLYVELLQRGLELLVVGAGALVDLLDLPAGSALAAIDAISLVCLIIPELPMGRSPALAGCGGGFANSVWCFWCGAVKIDREEVCLPCTHTHTCQQLSTRTA